MPLTRHIILVVDCFHGALSNTSHAVDALFRVDVQHLFTLMMTDQHWTSAELLTRFRAGEESAANELFERYVSRLTLLARARLSPRLAARTDPEDVVLSAWRSFFIGARNDHYSLRRSGDLWRLLVSITMHKLYRQGRHHSADRRSVDAEASRRDGDENWRELIDKEPTPEEAIALADELESILAQLDEFSQRVLELLLKRSSIRLTSDLRRLRDWQQFA